MPITLPTFIIYLLTIFTPLFFLPTTLNFFATNKQTLLIISLLTLMTYFIFKLLTTFHHHHRRSPLNLPLLLFTFSTLATILLTKELRFESIINRGSLYLTLILLTYLLSSFHLPTSTSTYFIATLIFTTTTLSLHSLAQLTFLDNLKSLPIWLQTKYFTPTGSLTTTLILLTIGLVLTLTWALKEKITLPKTLLFLLSALHLTALIAYLYTFKLDNNLPFLILPLQAGWSLALDALKTPRTLFFGIGLANFPLFFTLAKPLFLLTTRYWSFLPLASSNEYFHVLTTMGALGFISFMLLIITTIRLLSHLPHSHPHLLTKILFYLLVLSFLFTPANLITLTLFFLTIIIVNTQSSTTHPQPLSLNKPLATITALTLTGFILFTAYYTFRLYQAEHYMYRSQLALQNQDGKNVYQNQLKALNTFPYLSTYHLSFSQLNLQLASALSNKKDLTEKDKQQIAILIQQAIDQAKIALQLSPSNSLYWQNLAQIYSQLSSAAKNANQFASQYYQKAIQLDPANPVLRTQYASFLFQLARQINDSQQKQLQTNYLTQALSQLQTVIQLKPDYAPAYYLSAQIYKTTKNYTAAVQAMQQVVSLLNPDSPDYQQASQELDTLQSQLKENQPSPSPSPQASSRPQPQPHPSSTPQPSPLPTPSPAQ